MDAGNLSSAQFGRVMRGTAHAHNLQAAAARRRAGGGIFGDFMSVQPVTHETVHESRDQMGNLIHRQSEKTTKYWTGRVVSESEHERADGTIQSRSLSVTRKNPFGRGSSTTKTTTR